MGSGGLCCEIAWFSINQIKHGFHIIQLYPHPDLLPEGEGDNPLSPHTPREKEISPHPGYAQREKKISPHPGFIPE